MKLDTVIKELSLTLCAGEAPEKFDGVYAGDLLSRAMSRVTEGDLWITIMSNVNVVAVASLTEAAAVILAEGVRMTDEVLRAAWEKEVCILSSNMTVFELCEAISKIGR